MENTLESALLFFGAHLNSEAGCRAAVFHPSRHAINNEGKLIMSASILADIHEGTFSYKDFYLLRKPLSSITDEDAIEVVNIHGGFYGSYLDAEAEKLEKIATGKKLVDDFDNGNIWELTFESIDYLRLKGYALSYNGVSVEEQINRGWTKLKTE